MKRRPRKRSIRSRPVRGGARVEQRVVAPGGENVLEGERKLGIFASGIVPAAFVLLGCGRDDDRDVIFVEHIHAGDGIVHVDGEVDERSERDPLTLGERGLPNASSSSIHASSTRASPSPPRSSAAPAASGSRPKLISR